MELFPLMVNIEKRNILIVGGGPVAAGKLQRLAGYGACITLVAETVGREAADLCASSGAIVAQRRFEEKDLEGMDLCIAATGDRATDREIAACCRGRRIPVCTADTPEECDFTFPAVIRRGSLCIGIATDGKSPAMAAEIKARISAVLPEETESILDRMGDLRERLRERIPDRKERSRAYREILELLLSTDNAASDEEIEKIIESCSK